MNVKKKKVFLQSSILTRRFIVDLGNTTQEEPLTCDPLYWQSDCVLPDPPETSNEVTFFQA